MMKINQILDLFDWNNNPEVQQEGRALARETGEIEPFLQPCDEKYNKNVWDNCAMILAELPDAKLLPYSVQLLEWLEDLNWPGAICIFERLQQFSDIPQFNFALIECESRAKLLHDEQWLENLQSLRRTRAIINKTSDFLDFL